MLNNPQQFAPVLIITLNRYKLLKRCVDTLAANYYADRTDLFIAIDYPLNDEHFFEYNKILSYTDKIDGFKSINLIKRNINRGRVDNYLESMNEILAKYDKIIFSEDDNEFSPDFLSFMNKCLQSYRERNDIFSISGYNYPISIPQKYPYEAYKWMGHSAWGFGIWKEKWKKIDWSKDIVLNNIQQFFKQPKDVIRFNDVSNHYIPALLLMLKKKELHGDGYICLYQYLNNMYSIFPTISRVRNMGHDGSGANCRITDKYKHQIIYSGTNNYELPIEIEPMNMINNILKEHFRTSYLSKCRAAFDLIMAKLSTT
jgi:hypothetical protein